MILSKGGDSIERELRYVVGVTLFRDSGENTIEILSGFLAPCYVWTRARTFRFGRVSLKFFCFLYVDSVFGLQIFYNNCL